MNCNEKVKGPVKIIEISEKAFISIELLKNGCADVFDITLNLEEKTIFLGRFNNENVVNAKYKDGKILIYYDNVVNTNGQIEIVKVLSLYEIVDDTFYSCTEKEALELFDKSIDSRYLINKDNVLHRSDIAKKRKIKAK